MISVIVPTYQDSHFLKTLLPGLLREPVQMEIIVVDDGSTIPLDLEVRQLIDLHGLRYVRCDENAGLAAARNTGIELAKYDLIFPIDADDVLIEGGLKGLLDGVNSEYDIFYGNIMCAGNVSKPVPRPWTVATWRDRNPLFCSSLFRKEVWETVGGYLEREGPHYEDYRFWCTAWVRGCTFKYVDAMVYEHTERPDSMLRTLHPNREFYHNLAIEPLKEL